MNELIIIILLILFNGLLAMSEIALISARKGHLANEAKRGSKTAQIALRLANEPDRFLSTVQIGITVIGILTGIYSGNALADNLTAALSSWGITSSFAHPLAQVTIVILVTYLTLILGELVPKRIGMSVAERVAKLVAKPMYWLSVIASPCVWLLSKSTSFIFNLFGFKTDESKVTEAEIKLLIEEGTKDGEVQEVEQDIMERVFLLGDLKVSSLMTHRSDVATLDIHMSSAEIKENMKLHLHQMYPVIDRTFDNVVGVVLLKDIVFDLNNSDFHIAQAVTQAVYFHENMSVYKVLEQMKELRISQALICDEFGSCEGVITLKDILEGLVGTLDDRQSEPDIIKRQDTEEWLADGQCSIVDFLTYFDRQELHSPDCTYNTIGGLLLEHLEHIPHSGEKVNWENFTFEIADMDGARIDKILVTMK